MSVTVPITNIFGGGDYTVQLQVGSKAVPVNVIVDTGSSTLAVQQTRYKAADDRALNPTAWAQDVVYGTGGWAGPVVLTDLTMGADGESVTLKNAPMAIASEQEPNNFGDADGILGLAYTPLNGGANLHSYLVQRGINPAVTFPWPFAVQNTAAGVKQFENFLRSMPAQSITPYFTLLEQEGVIPNKFALYTLRSAVSAALKDPSQDRLNAGYLVLGGGEEQNGLYTGNFVNVDVLDDLYYNTNLKAVQVEGCPAIAVKQLPQQLQAQLGSNSIIDSGTNSLVLADDVFSAIMNSLRQLSPEFVQIAEKALKSRAGLPSTQLKLADWPGITFILAGENGEDIPLTCAPETYWQTDAPSKGHAVFQIFPGGQLPQSILGLPLMNNYYTVFDRSVDVSGVIRFAAVRPSAQPLAANTGR
ncbi:MAG TPA: pepsin-like aspartic protease [Bryobacteraceae bacterium]|nr:pepsin-like aspartic protease [Bryobacteraceae bacterium]